MQIHLYHIYVKFEYKGIWVKVKVYEKNDNFTYFNMLILYIWLQVINEAKVTHHDEGPFQFNVKLYLFQHSNPLYVATSH